MYAVDWYGEKTLGYGWHQLWKEKTKTSAVLLAVTVESHFHQLTRVRDIETGKILWHGREGMAYMSSTTLREPVIRGD